MKKLFGQKTRKNITAFAFVMCMVVVGGMAVYYQYMKKQQLQTEVQTPTTEVEKLIARDLEVGYPETPTEVLKLWGRISQCMYNTSLDDKEFISLLQQLRAMYSSDLLAQNPENNHSAKLKSEVEEFKNEKNKIVNYSADTGTSVQYKTIQNRECAYARLSFFVNKSGSYVKSYQDFILVKENDKWKILGFKGAATKQSTKEEATAN